MTKKRRDEVKVPDVWAVNPGYKGAKISRRRARPHAPQGPQGSVRHWKSGAKARTIGTWPSAGF